MFPNFLCIGAQRSGTTWLHMNLKEHPEVWMPPLKEIQYFDEKEMFDSLPLVELFAYKHLRYTKRWKRVFNSLSKKLKKSSQLLDLETLRWYIRYLFGFRSDRWYASLFEMGAGKKIGDITPGYGPLSKESVAHIHTLMPDVKIIFLMRNPIQRAWSHFLKEIRDKKRPLESVSEREFINHFNSDKSRAKSNYSQIIETWNSYYSDEQLFTAFFEEISNCPENLLFRIFNFIEVEASSKYISVKKSSKKYNASSNTGIIPGNFTVPDNFAKYLARAYYDEIEQLHRNFGGYASSWLEDADRLLELVN